MRPIFDRPNSCKWLPHLITGLIFAVLFIVAPISLARILFLECIPALIVWFLVFIIFVIYIFTKLLRNTKEE